MASRTLDSWFFRMVAISHFRFVRIVRYMAGIWSAPPHPVLGWDHEQKRYNNGRQGSEILSMPYNSQLANPTQSRAIASMNAARTSMCLSSLDANGRAIKWSSDQMVHLVKMLKLLDSRPFLEQAQPHWHHVMEANAIQRLFPTRIQVPLFPLPWSSRWHSHPCPSLQNVTIIPGRERGPTWWGDEKAVRRPCGFLGSSFERDQDGCGKALDFHKLVFISHSQCDG